jgi:hypothetical protein
MTRPIDLLEEAIHLLRRTSALTYAYYLIGVAPFTIVLLQFLVNASYHRYAAEHLVESAAELVIAYAWMKGFQAMACRQLLATSMGDPVRPLSLLDLVRLWLAQWAIQPLGILAKPMAFLVLVPSPFVDAFFQNASILLTGRPGDLARCIRFSKGEIGPSLVLQAVIFIFRVVVFAAVYSAFATLPFLARTLFGIDTPLTRSYEWLLSLPFILGTGFQSYLLIDLLVKSVYVVRITTIECASSGKDLLRRLAALGYDTAK